MRLLIAASVCTMIACLVMLTFPPPEEVLADGRASIASIDGFDVDASIKSNVASGFANTIELPALPTFPALITARSAVVDPCADNPYSAPYRSCSKPICRCPQGSKMNLDCCCGTHLGETVGNAFEAYLALCNSNWDESEAQHTAICANYAAGEMTQAERDAALRSLAADHQSAENTYKVAYCAIVKAECCVQEAGGGAGGGF